MSDSGPVLHWDIECNERYAIAIFRIAREDGILDHALLREVQLPPEVLGREDRGLIIGGKGPIWLYAHLTHLAHTFAWVAVFEPRLRRAVVVQRHTKDSPRVGEVLPCELPKARDAGSASEGLLGTDEVTPS